MASRNAEVVPLVIDIIKELSDEGFGGDYAKRTSEKLLSEYNVVRSKGAVLGMLRRNGYSIARIKHQGDLDVDKVIDAYNLDQYAPVEYKIDWDMINVSTHALHKILCIGDFQAGSLTNAHGHDPTPMETLKARFDILKRRFGEVYKKEPFEKLTVFMLGDLVDGELIYQGQKTLPIQQQVIGVADLIYDLIMYLKAFVPDITIYSVAGNHGRLSKYYQKESNWDSIVAYVLSLRLENEEGITFDFDEDRYQLVDVDNWKFLLHHGDITRSFDPNKWMEIIQKYKLFRWNELDAVVFGHWHRIFMGETFDIPMFVNGTMYESPFVQEVLAGKESLAFLLLTVGQENPIDKVEILDLRN